MRTWIVVSLLLAFPAAGLAETIAEKTKSARKLDGFLPLYWDEEAGKLLLEVGQLDREILYQVGLATGVGSNPIGLDRGQLGETRVVVFRKVGPKLLLVEPNQRYRALSDDAAERKAVEESFAQSILWGFKVEAAEEGRVLVDATAFFLRDAHGVADRLRRSKQGSYKLDGDRSALYLDRTRAFPKNTEVEAILTFAGDEPGPLVSRTAPTPQALTVRQHHSFVELPTLDGSFKPRPADPRVGAIPLEFYDYATPINRPIETRWIIRHRLRRRDPEAKVGEADRPIVYYVDPGAPEPIRRALIDGASWWAEAFEAAGFRDGFRVEVLPEGADPMDLRYNMIHWVHRSTRGWSYGNAVVDPRTGEILKGNVTLGSLRVRQDHLIGTGLVPQTVASAGRSCELGMAPGDDHLAALDPAIDVEAMALARIRQLSAHEVGHTLGFAHNFAASTYGRASVMDYPAPLVTIKDGKLDLSDAYASGIGRYDKFAVAYAYTQFDASADERKELDRIVREGIAAGMLFLTDADARPAGAAHPLANLWDNGDDPVAMLRHQLEVRRIGLERFGLDSIAEGTPLSLLEAKLLPLYLHHRYQLQAAAKTLGGASYTHAVKAGDGPVPSEVVEVVPAARQREALAALLDCLDPEALTLPDRILSLIPPRPGLYDDGTVEMFPARTSPLFDPLAAATVAADLPVSALLQPERAARLVDFASRAADQPGFEEVVAALIQRTWDGKRPGDARQAAVFDAIRRLVVTRLIDLAGDPEAATTVRAVATKALTTLAGRLAVGQGPQSAFEVETLREINRFLDRPGPTDQRSAPPSTPQGDPIGSP